MLCAALHIEISGNTREELAVRALLADVIGSGISVLAMTSGVLSPAAIVHVDFETTLNRAFCINTIPHL
jgi:hypothetical protein